MQSYILNYTHTYSKKFTITINTSFYEEILSKKIDWSILAQSDYYAVERYEEKHGRQPMRQINRSKKAFLLEKVPMTIYGKKHISIVPDDYGGSRLINTEKISSTDGDPQRKTSWLYKKCSRRRCQ